MAVRTLVPFSTEPPSDLRTIVEIARYRAQTQPDDIAFTFLRDGEYDEFHLDYGELDRQARAIAGELQQRGAPGQRVLLTFDPGLEYITAFYGCLYAGAVPVPVYPPDPFTLQRTLPRLKAIVDDAQAGLVFGSEEIVGWCGIALGAACATQVMSPFDVGDGSEVIWSARETCPTSLAFLQYTSGSTGSPKGVMISHANLLDNLLCMHRRLDVESAVGVTWLPPYHDMGLIGTVLLPVFSARRVVFMSPLSFIQRPARWLHAITRFRGTTSASPNFGYDLCVRKVRLDERQGLDLSSWQVALSGAEPVRADTLDRFVEAFADCGFRRSAFYPSYGMAESTLMVSGGLKDAEPVIRTFSARALERDEGHVVDTRHPDARRLVGCGKPNPGHELIVVDPHTRLPLRAGQVGELWLRGPSVTSGYWNQPELNRQAIGARLADAPQRGPFLRTGDLGFIHRGELFITGRLKDLLILWGRNYYPQDIERTVERAHESLKPDGVAAFSVEVDGEERLVVVSEVLRPRKHNLDDVVQAIRKALAEADGLAPHAVVLIANGSLPKTTSGKTQRRQCRQAFLDNTLDELIRWTAAGGSQSHRVDASSAAPQTELETRLVALWRDVLGTAVGRDDDFFALGGQSLRAGQLVARIRDELGVPLPLAALFEYSTPALLAAAIERGRSSWSTAGACWTAPMSRDPSQPSPLSFAQRRFWFLEQFSPGHPMTFVPMLLRLRGNLDVGRLHGALRELAWRHEILRTRIHEVDGQACLDVVDAGDFEWRELDWRRMPGDESSRLLQQLLADERRRRFDCVNGPLWRVIAARLSDDETALLFVFHHLVCDGAAIGVLLDELATMYGTAGAPTATALPPAPHYRDYVAWQQQALSDEQLEDDLHWWRDELADAPESIDLPTDHPRRDDLFEPVTLVRRIDAAARMAIEQQATAARATPFMLWLAAWSAVVARHGQTLDVCVAVGVSGRERPEWQRLVGCLLNTVVVRTDLSGQPDSSELLARTRRAALDALSRGHVPFERLVEVLEPVREAGRMPLAQVLLLYQDHDVAPRRLGQIDVAEVQVDYTPLAGYDLTLVVEPAADGWKLSVVYNQAWFDAATVERIADALVDTLSALAAAQPTSWNSLPIPAAAARRQLLVDFNQTARNLPAYVSTEDWIAETAAQYPERLAIETASDSISYGELDRRANRLARRLQLLGVGPDIPVGICLDRSIDLVTAMLAVWKAGGAYVPLDPRYPQERIHYMVDNAQMPVLLTHSTQAATLGRLDALVLCLDQLPDDNLQLSDARPLSTAGGDHLAYLIYTSGSTGQPKGVMVTRAGVLNFLASFARQPGLSKLDVLLAVTTVSFDIAVLELFLPLVVGARVVLAGQDETIDADRLAALIATRGVTTMQATPATWRMLLSAGWRPTRGLRLLCGGEALDPALARELSARGNELWNLYGPTETTIWSTVHRVDAVSGTIPIGRPIDNTEVYVLDADGNPAPLGVPGELYIGGLGVARGYWRRDELTAQRFVPLPATLSDGAAGHDGQSRLFRTGDRVRWRADGLLEFFGRLDAQIKVRGFRVEPTEIEAVLARHPGVAEAAVVGQADSSGEQRLVAFFVPRDGHSPSTETLRTFLAGTLPDYMIPSLFVEFDRLPRTPAGKIDRRALPAVEGAVAATTAEYIAPRTPLEADIAAAWCEVLRVERVGARDNFFELGGHSLLAMQLVTRLRALAGPAIAVRHIFERPTVEQQAEWLLTLRLQQLEQPDAERLLMQLESLSDDEAQALSGDNQER